jgi:predicted flap endonuclease-1-like 5' DNA nuclease
MSNEPINLQSDLASTARLPLPTGRPVFWAFAIVTLLIAVLCLFYGLVNKLLPDDYLTFIGVVSLPIAWGVYNTEYRDLSWLRIPLAIAMIVIGLAGIATHFEIFMPGKGLVMLSGAVGTIAGIWLWCGGPLGLSEWMAGYQAEAELVSVDVCVACDGPQKVVHLRQQVADAEDRVREANNKVIEARKKQRLSNPVSPAPAPMPVTRRTARVVKTPAAKVPVAKAPAPKAAAPKIITSRASSSKREKFTTTAPAPKNLIKRKPAKTNIDDLKQVTGIGPAFEKLLNTNGVWQFRQLADFRKADVEWLSAQIGSFPDRIARDEWVKQAKTLARKKK